MPNRRRLSSLIVLALLLISSLPVSFAEPYDPLNPYFQGVASPESPVVLERGVNYVISDLGGGKRSWESVPQYVYDGANWVPHIYSRDEAKKCYNVQVGFVAARIYDTGIVEIYDPALSEVRVKGESWEVWAAGKRATLNVPITWGVVTNSSGVFITRRQTTSKPDGVLMIEYIFLVGSGLKHTVTWTSTGVAAVTVQVKQVHLMNFDKVTTDAGVSLVSKSEKSAAYLFGYGSKDFWVLEDQSAMVYDSTGALLTEKCLQSGEIDFAGKKVTYTFGDWTLIQGELLVIDPATATLNNPTEDGFIDYVTTYARDTVYVELWVGRKMRPDELYHYYRGYAEWNISSIPTGATITDTVFKYHGSANGIDCHIHAISGKPSTATNANLWADIADGTVYADVAGFPVVGTNKEIDLGATADSDLQGLLASDWFAIGIQGDSETGSSSAIYSEEYATATPKPTLYVEYTPPNTAPVNDACDSTATFDYDTLGWVNVTVTDTDLVANLYTVSIKITTSDSLTSNYTWTQSTNTFAETADANGISSIDAASARVNIDADTDKIAFKVKFTQVPALGNCAVRAYTKDDSGASDTDTYSNEFRLIFAFRTPTKSLTLGKNAARLGEWSRTATKTLTLAKAATKLIEVGKATAITIATSLNAARLIDVAKAAAQGLTFSVSVSNLYEWLRAATQSVSLTNGAAKLIELTQAATVTISLAPNAARIIEILRAATQAITMSNAVDMLVEFTRAAMATISLAPNTARLAEYLKIATQGLSVSNAATRLFEALRTASRTLILGNAVTRLIEVSKAATQAITTGFAVSRGLEIIRGVTQLIITGVSASRLLEVARISSLGLSLGASVSRLIEVAKAGVMGLTFSDAASRLAEFTRAVTQSIPFTADAVRRIIIEVSISLSVTITQGSARLYEALRAATQGVTLNNVASKLFEVIRTATQGLTLDNTASRIGEWIRDITQTITLGNVTSTFSEWIRVATQGLIMSNAATQLIEITKIVTQTLTFTASSLRGIIIEIATHLSLTITQSGARLIEAIRNTTQGITLSSSANGLLDAYRAASQSLILGLSTLAEKISTYIRGASVTIATTLNVARLTEITKNVIQAITTNLAATRLYEALRTATQSLTVDGFVNRIMEATRSVTQGLSLISDAIGVFTAAVTTYTRAASQLIATGLAATRETDVGRAATQAITMLQTAIGYLNIEALRNAAAIITFKAWGYPFGISVGGGISWWLVIVVAVVVFFLILGRRR